MAEEERSKKNEAVIEGDRLTIRVHFNTTGGLAMALGSIEMAKDLAKDWFVKRAMREAAEHQSSIIRPGIIS